MSQTVKNSIVGPLVRLQAQESEQGIPLCKTQKEGEASCSHAASKSWCQGGGKGLPDKEHTTLTIWLKRGTLNSGVLIIQKERLSVQLSATCSLVMFQSLVTWAYKLPWQVRMTPVILLDPGIQVLCRDSHTGFQKGACNFSTVVKKEAATGGHGQGSSLSQT